MSMAIFNSKLLVYQRVREKKGNMAESIKEPKDWTFRKICC